MAINVFKLVFKPIVLLCQPGLCILAFNHVPTEVQLLGTGASQYSCIANSGDLDPTVFKEMLGISVYGCLCKLSMQ